ncbi:MAG: hypothetical protein ACOYJ8_03365 [Patescibacteria group bacterium]
MSNESQSVEKARTVFAEIISLFEKGEPFGYSIASRDFPRVVIYYLLVAVASRGFGILLLPKDEERKLLSLVEEKKDKDLIAVGEISEELLPPPHGKADDRYYLVKGLMTVAAQEAEEIIIISS